MPSIFSSAFYLLFKMDSQIRILIAEEGLRRIRNSQEPQEHDPRDNPKGLPLQPIHRDDENRLSRVYAFTNLWLCRFRSTRKWPSWS